MSLKALCLHVYVPGNYFLRAYYMRDKKDDDDDDDDDDELIIKCAPVKSCKHPSSRKLPLDSLMLLEMHRKDARDLRHQKTRLPGQSCDFVARSVDPFQ